MRSQLIQVFILFTLASSCFGFINLRGFFSSQVNDQPSCTIPCQSITEQVLPGAVLGFNQVEDGFTFENWLQKDNLDLCCSKKKTFNSLKNFIVPDFVADVQNANLPDLEEITANVTEAVQTESQKRKYSIDIQHLFQRRAFVIKADVSKLSVNMTSILNTVPDPSQCDLTSFDFDWNSAITQLGSYVLSEVTIGTFQNVTVQIFTNKKYSKEEVIKNYKSHIAKQSLHTIDKAFKDSDVNSIGDLTQGGVFLTECDNWSDYLKKIGPQNYVFGKRSIKPDSQSKFSSIKSYELFDSQSPQIKNCAQEIWEYREKLVNPKSE